MNQFLQTEFVQVALPLIATIAIAAWINGHGTSRGFDGVNRRIDDLRKDMNDRFKEVNRRLDAIDTKLSTHSEDIARLKERTSPIVRTN